MSKHSTRSYVAGAIAAGIICLAFVALSKGTAELMALAAMLSAGATLLANMEKKER